VSYIHCPECGFQNPEAANYCSKCGALLPHDEPGAHTTMTFTPEEVTEDESLSLAVSRRHAVLVHRDDGYYIDDEESLNGTYVNRRRVESAKLEDGDEVQIGKYRLTFLES
jgi:FHA domain/zinc-ribbon domain